MNRKQALSRLQKLARESHEILNKLAQMPPEGTPNMAMPTGQATPNAAQVETAVRSKLEAAMPGASKLISSLSFGELNSEKPAVFLRYRSTPQSTALKSAVTQAANDVLGKNVNLQAVGEF